MLVQSLITDLAYDKISLSTAATRAKLIAYTLDIPELKLWLNNELNGYPSLNNIPDYRKVSHPRCFGNITEKDGRVRYNNTPIHTFDLIKQLGPDHSKSLGISEINIESGISEIESLLEKGLTKSPWPSQLIEIANSTEGCISEGWIITSAWTHIPINLYKSILENFKQRLLDTLLDLKGAFPDIPDNFKPSDEQSNFARQIVNQHFYGGQNNSPVSLGNNNTQNTHQVNNYPEHLLDDLRNDLTRYTVPVELIEELITFIKEDPGNKLNITQKAFNWIGTLLSKITTEGAKHLLEQNLPLITDRITKFIGTLPN